MGTIKAGYLRVVKAADDHPHIAVWSVAVVFIVAILVF